MMGMTDLDTRPAEGADCELLAGTPYADLLDAPPAEVDPRFVARLDDVARAERRRQGRHVSFAVLAVALAALVGLVAASGLFAARRIDVRGTVHLSADDVRRAAALRGAPSMLTLDRAAVARRRRAAGLGRRRSGVGQLAEHARDPGDGVGAGRLCPPAPRSLGAAQLGRQGARRGAGAPDGLHEGRRPDERAGAGPHDRRWQRGRRHRSRPRDAAAPGGRPRPRGRGSDAATRRRARACASATRRPSRRNPERRWPCSVHRTRAVATSTCRCPRRRCAADPAQAPATRATSMIVNRARFLVESRCEPQVDITLDLDGGSRVGQ